MTVPFAAFASGSGTNLQALLDAEAGGAAFRIALLVTDRECGAEERVRRLDRPVARIPFRDRAPEEIGRDVLEQLNSHEIAGIVLAGFLRLIPADVVAAYPRRILNVHPALLPAFGGKGMYGMNVHRAVLASGAKISGPTVHFADDRYDEGAILAQWPVPVLADDTPETLAARVLAAEHGLFPAAVDALAQSIRDGGDVAPFEWPGTGTGSDDGAHAPLHHQARKAFGRTHG